MHERPSWDEYFLHLVDEVAQRATCDRGRSGCLIVREKRILATGYVGSPPGQPHCDEVGHLFRQVIDENGDTRQHCVRTIHAEQNAICQAARYGIALQDTTLYCTMEPCRTCAMLIVSVGIKRVVARKMYQAGGDTRQLFQDAGVELVVADPSVEEY
jgi:dCMP deaminase